MARSAKSRAKLPRSAKKAGDGELGGFTIIEVVLVLAIAALIFLMVFIALPTLQRNQRDTQRRNDLARVSSQITNWQSNNSGKLPKDTETGAIEAVEEETDGAKLEVLLQKCGNQRDARNDAACLIANYLNGSGDEYNTFTDPSGWTYGLTIDTLTNGDDITISEPIGPEDGQSKYMIYIHKKAKCDGEFATYSNNARDYAVMYKLEGNGVYCKDNQ